MQYFFHVYFLISFYFHVIILKVFEEMLQESDVLSLDFDWKYCFLLNIVKFITIII